MQTREIPRSEWASFLQGFSTQHQGWLANVERRQYDSSSSSILTERPLMEIHADIKAGRIDLLFGRPDGEQFNEVVKQPVRIKFQEAEPGAHAGLEIQSADQSSLLLRFRSAMPPEMIDGIAA
jgi:Family of unknown function (DUF5335)